LISTIELIVRLLCLIFSNKVFLHYAQEVSKVVIQLADLLKWALTHEVLEES
jgi:hypothetical protein